MKSFLFSTSLFILAGLLYCFVSHLVDKYKKEPLPHKESVKLKSKLKSMNPRQYEVFCSNLFSSLGYKVIITKASNDGGKDIVLKKLNKTYYVECKCYNNSPVSRPVAQKLVGALVGDKISPKNGVLITTSTFSSGCREYSNNLGLRLIDLNETLKLLASLDQSKRKEII